jgi:CHAT domain-containing protein
MIRLSRLLSLLILSLLIPAGPLAAQDSGTDPAVLAKQLMDKRDYDGAIQAWRTVLAKATPAGDLKTEAQAWLMIGRCFARKQELVQAVDAFSSSAKSADAAGDNAQLGDALNGEMSAEYGLGRFDEAEKHGRRAGEAYAAAGDRRMVTGMKVNVAVMLGEKGDLNGKATLLREAAREAEAGGFDSFLANALNNLGVLYCEQGDYSRGVQYLDRATELVARIAPNDHTRMAMFHTNLGAIYLYLGRTQQALAEDAKAETEARTAGDESILMGIRSNRAELYSRTGDNARALVEVQPAIEYFDRSDQRRDAFTPFVDQIEWMVRAGRYQDAVARGEKLLPEARGLGPMILYRLLDSLGGAYAGAQRFTDARKSYLEAIAAIESVKLSGGEDERESFFHEKCGPYLGMAQLLIRDGKPFEALQYSERAKARLLLDVLRGARTEINRVMTEEEKQKERDLTNQIDRLDAQLAAEGTHVKPETLARRDQLKSETDSLLAELYQKHPELRAQRGEFRPLAETDLASLLGNSQTAVLEFAILERGAFVFAVTRDQAGVAHVESHPVKLEGLESDVNRFRTQLADRDLGYRESARALYARLFGPAAAALRNKKRLVIVPDGPLWELPFQALVSPSGKYLIEDATVFYAPSLQAAREMRSLPRTPADSSRTLLAIGAPAKSAASLPVVAEASRELRQVGEIYGARASDVLMGDQADKQRWKDEAPNYRILHVAAHGVLDSNNPLSSFLDLNRTSGDMEDNVLSAREILRMRLRADVAVLSACETARGKYRFGEGMIGMSWAFLIAGTPTTVVSQWKVDSASTSQLMVGFHKNLKSHPEFSGKADALRAAALAVLGNPQYRHPFYWAGFVVVGDGF